MPREARAAAGLRISEYFRRFPPFTGGPNLRKKALICGKTAALNWISVHESLPDDGQRVLAFLPKNVVYLPGKSGDMRFLPVIPLRFAEDFFAKANPKREKFGPHFWLGEGQSNHYFDDVTHWMPMPDGPNGEQEELRRAD